MIARQQHAQAARNAALNELDAEWGELYDLAVTNDGWVAKRLDNNCSIVAGNPRGLQVLISADHAAGPVRRHLPPDAARPSS